MRITHVYVTQPLSVGSPVELTGQAQHHLAVVLRAKVGQGLVLFNGDGNNYWGDITALSKKSLQISLHRCEPNLNESPLRIHLGQCLSSAQRFDWAIQKATEMGATEITPLLSEHAQKLSPKQFEKKQAHWQHIAINAAEQSHRAIVPTVHLPINLPIWLEQIDAEQKWVCAIPKQQAAQKPNSVHSLALLTGPEGGLSSHELTQAQAADFNCIQLGGRVLRTETAPIAAMALAQSLWGDITLN